MHRVPAGTPYAAPQPMSPGVPLTPGQVGIGTASGFSRNAMAQPSRSGWGGVANGTPTKSLRNGMLAFADEAETTDGGTSEGLVDSSITSDDDEHAFSAAFLGTTPACKSTSSCSFVPAVWSQGGPGVYDNRALFGTDRSPWGSSMGSANAAEFFMPDRSWGMAGAGEHYASEHFFDFSTEPAQRPAMLGMQKQPELLRTQAPILSTPQDSVPKPPSSAPPAPPVRREPLPEEGLVDLDEEEGRRRGNSLMAMLSIGPEAAQPALPAQPQKPSQAPVPPPALQPPPPQQAPPQAPKPAQQPAKVQQSQHQPAPRKAERPTPTSVPVVAKGQPLPRNLAPEPLRQPVAPGARPTPLHNNATPYVPGSIAHGTSPSPSSSAPAPATPSPVGALSAAPAATTPSLVAGPKSDNPEHLTAILEAAKRAFGEGKATVEGTTREGFTVTVTGGLNDNQDGSRVLDMLSMALWPLLGHDVVAISPTVIPKRSWLSMRCLQEDPARVRANCWDFAVNGSCPRGKRCRWPHVPLSTYNVDIEVSF